MRFFTELRRELRQLVVAGGLLAMSAGPTVAQSIEEVTADPDRTADLFVRSVRAIRWNTAAQFMHPATLDRFRMVVTMIVDADSTGDVRRFLADADSAEFAALEAAEIFDRAIGAMIDDMPGLMHAIFDRDDEVIGHVAESGDTAHVVYRTTARISGAQSEVKVMQLVRTGTGWRVFWSDELEVLDAALRGIARRSPPPPPPATSPSSTASDSPTSLRRSARVASPAPSPPSVAVASPTSQVAESLEPVGARSLPPPPSLATADATPWWSPGRSATAGPSRSPMPLSPASAPAPFPRPAPPPALVIEDLEPEVWLGASVGSTVGLLLGYQIAGVFAPDLCQETCAGMWLTVPAGAVLGATGGAVIAGRQPKRALVGAAIGLAGVVVPALVIPEAGVPGGVAFVVLHGALTSMLSG